MSFLARFKAIIAAVLVAAGFMAIGWREIFPYSFPDLENYRAGFQSGWYVFTVLNLGAAKFLINEGVWIFLFDDLWRSIGNIDASFFVVSCAAIFGISYYICYRTGRIWPALFVFSPVVVNLVIEQLRSGIATALFFCGTLSKSWYIRIPLFFAAICFHTAFLFFVIFYIVFDITERTPIGEALKSRPIVSLFIIIIFAGFAVYFRQSALTAIGDRRAFDVVDQGTGYLLVLGWTLFLATFFIARNDERLEFEFYFFVLSLFMLFFSVIFQTYGSRFIAIAVPALACMSRQIKPKFLPFFVLHYLAFTVVYFIIWSS